MESNVKLLILSEYGRWQTDTKKNMEAAMTK